MCGTFSFVLAHHFHPQLRQRRDHFRMQVKGHVVHGVITVSKSVSTALSVSKGLHMGCPVQRVEAPEAKVVQACNDISEKIYPLARNHHGASQRTLAEHQPDSAWM